MFYYSSSWEKDENPPLILHPCQVTSIFLCSSSKPNSSRGVYIDSLYVFTFLPCRRPSVRLAFPSTSHLTGASLGEVSLDMWCSFLLFWTAVDMSLCVDWILIYAVLCPAHLYYHTVNFFFFWSYCRTFWLGAVWYFILNINHSHLYSNSFLHVEDTNI